MWGGGNIYANFLRPLIEFSYEWVLVQKVTKIETVQKTYCESRIQCVQILLKRNFKARNSSLTQSGTCYHSNLIFLLEVKTLARRRYDIDVCVIISTQIQRSTCQRRAHLLNVTSKESKSRRVRQYTWFHVHGEGFTRGHATMLVERTKTARIPSQENSHSVRPKKHRWVERNESTKQ